MILRSSRLCLSFISNSSENSQPRLNASRLIIPLPAKASRKRVLSKRVEKRLKMLSRSREDVGRMGLLLGGEGMLLPRNLPLVIRMDMNFLINTKIFELLLYVYNSVYQ